MVMYFIFNFLVFSTAFEIAMLPDNKKGVKYTKNTT